MEKTRVAVLVSGGGTNLQAIIDAEKSGKIRSGEVVLVIADHSDAYALTRAKNAGIKTEIVLKKDFTARVDFNLKIADILEENEIELIVLAGFMSILTKEFTDRYPERIINIHPALIPSFCGEGFYGLKVHEAALAYGVKLSGATVHFVNEIADGGKIIAQKAVEVLDGDTPEVLQRRIMEQAEWIILPQAVEDISRKIAEEKQ